MKDKVKLEYLLPLRCIVFLLFYVIKAMRMNSDISSWSVIASITNIFTIYILTVAAKSRGMTYSQLINFRKGQFRANDILLIIAFAAVGMAGMFLAALVCYGTIQPEVSVRLIAPIPPFFAMANFLLLPITAALAEDGLYLGCGTARIENKYAAVIVPTFFYALQHCFIPAIFDVRYMVYRFLMFLPLAMIFCLYYQKKRSPLPLMISHGLLDLATSSSILAMSVIPSAYEQWAG
ncbi:MAG TPA: CPBP family glutamic-type intramembrane protease [Ruminococcus sp.]|nr:CPBP family glutamic-type intramembrane protease [Ruminococcus sp.]